MESSEYWKKKKSCPYRFFHYFSKHRLHFILVFVLDRVLFAHKNKNKWFRYWSIQCVRENTMFFKKLLVCYQEEAAEDEWFRHRSIQVKIRHNISKVFHEHIWICIYTLF
jgi:hypothetical protein